MHFSYFFMAKIKDPYLRAFTSKYGYLIKEVKSLRYLYHLHERMIFEGVFPNKFICLDENSGSWYICNKNGESLESIENFCNNSIKDIRNENSLPYTIDEIRQDFCRLAESERRKHLRIKSIVYDLLQSECLFLSLTFTDEFLNSNNYVNRRRKVREYLNSLGCHYIANIDFGKLNGREHYHAIVQIDKVNHKDYKFGNLDFERITLANESKLANYINKLVIHSVKDSASGYRIMKK